MKLKYFNQLFESIDIDSLTDEEFDEMLNKLITVLDEYKNSILDNISYNLKTNKIEYKEFTSLNIENILEQLSSKIDKDVLVQFNVESFLRKLSQIIDLKKRNTKRKIKEEFKTYYESLTNRFDEPFIDADDLYDTIDNEKSLIPRKVYDKEKYEIQIELLKLQEWVVKNNKRVAIIFEGRDSAGKGSSIKRFVEYLNPKHFRVVALGMPSEEEKNNWFERYKKHLPKNGEIVFFDRSYYNRAVVEPAMGYCTEDQYKDFMEKVLDWEEDLIKGGMYLIKFWFSITKEKQLHRFKMRQTSPLKYWKFSPNDAKVIDKWDLISKYKNQMFMSTSSRLSPWVVIITNDKRAGRLNSMRYVLSVIPYDDKNEKACRYYPEVVNIIE